MGVAAPIIAIAATVVSTAVGVYSAVQSGQAQSSQRRAQADQQRAQAEAARIEADAARDEANARRQQSLYMANIAQQNEASARKNAQIQRMNATYVEQAAALQMDDRARQIRGTIGAQRAGFASSGLLIDEGTALDLQDDTAELGDMAINEIQRNAARSAVGYRVGAQNADADAVNAGTRLSAYLDEADFALQAGEAKQRMGSIRASSFEAAAGASSKSAASALEGSWTAAAGTLAGGLSSSLDRWDRYSRPTTSTPRTT